MSTAQLAPSTPQGPAVTRVRREGTSSWPLIDRVALWLCWGTGIGLCLVALAIVLFMLVKGISHLHLDMLVPSPAPSALQSQSGGILDPIVGTLIVALIGTLIAAPLGVAIAAWLAEYRRPSWLAHVVESAIDRGQFLRCRLIDARSLRLDSTRRLHQRFLILKGPSVDARKQVFQCGDHGRSYSTAHRRDDKRCPNSRRLERKAVRGLGDAQPTAAHEDVHMRQRLAESERELVRIVDIASENDRHEFGDRLRPPFAGLDNRDAARLMVSDEFVGARMQAHERQPVPRQNEYILRQRRLEPFK